MALKFRAPSGAFRATATTTALLTTILVMIILGMCLEHPANALMGKQLRVLPLTRPYDTSRIGRRRRLLGPASTNSCLTGTDQPSSGKDNQNQDPVDYLLEQTEADETANDAEDRGDKEDSDGDTFHETMGSAGAYSQESLLQVYARDRKWLEKATDDIMDEEQYPIGELSQADIDSIVGLMVAWVKRRSMEAGLAVEKLLVRVVTDMRANNPVARTNARMYALVRSSQYIHLHTY